MKSKLVPLFLVLACAGLLLFGCSSCSSGPQRVAYQTVGTASVTVEMALGFYDAAAAQGKTTMAQNAAVKAAYLKYQAAFAAVCDAGAAYAAAGADANAPMSAALQQAILNASTTLTDLVNLIKSFGIQL